MSVNELVGNLDAFVRRRAGILRLSLSDVAQRSGLSRQALYRLLEGRKGELRLCSFVRLAGALQVHPIILLRYVCSAVHLPGYASEVTHYKHDGSGFIQDVTVPDNSPVMADSRFQKIWEIQNVGQAAWVDRALLCVDEELEVISKSERLKPVARRGLMPDQRRIPVPRTQPGESVRLGVWFTAPSYPCTLVSYWKMVDERDNLCFPDMEGLSCQVRVVPL
ncbi:MAG TPA: NBR1-Ig-like domain-containing protein [Methylococcaceae bacterium]|nr:NBR1-Ig-like domain-containing protein [Methylococcaceae bacterium]